MFLTEKGHGQGNIALTHRQLNFSTSTKVQKGRSVPGPKLPPGSPNAIQRVQMKDVSWKIASLSAVQRRRSAHIYTHTHSSSSSPDKSGTRTGNFGPKIMLRANFFPPPVPSCYPTLQLYATLPPKHARIGLLSQQTNRVILSSNHDIMTI